MSGVDLKVNLLYKHIFNKEQLNKELSGVGRDMAKHWASITPKTFDKAYAKFRPTMKTFFDKTFKTIVGTGAHESDLTKMWYRFFQGINKKGQLSHFLSLEDRLEGRANPSNRTLQGLASRFAQMTLQGEVQQGIEEERQRKLEEKKAKQKEILKGKIEGARHKVWQDMFMESVSGLTSRNPIFDKMRKYYQQQDKIGKEEANKIKKLEDIKHKSWQDIFMGSIGGLTARNPIFDKMKKFYLQQDKNAKAEARRIELNKKEEDKLRKKQLMLMLGKWGSFGVWGMIAQQVIRLISSGVKLVYGTAMQGLDWQRTVSGGASGGGWFGQGLAAYQRAGINPSNYQNFKRGVQGYLGQVKLGMGNAAPLMYLGLNALDDPDVLEKQLEKALRRLPKDVSLAMAGQMGLDYAMWEAIYSGRIDRTKEAYSDEAMKKWSEVADRMNEMLVSFKTFFFNKSANVFYNLMNPKATLKSANWVEQMSMALGATNPLFSFPALVRFSTIEVTVKNDKGEVIGKGETKPEIDNAALQFLGSSGTGS